MVAFRKIDLKNSVAKECAKMIQKYSWGLDYPVNAWDEIKQSNLLVGAFNGKKLVGCASINKVASPDKIDNGKFWFADAVVLPEYQKLGIYKTLYEKRLEYLKKNAKFAFACTDNPVIENFFLKKGWKLYRKTNDESGEECKVFQVFLKIN